MPFDLAAHRRIQEGHRGIVLRIRHREVDHFVALQVTCGILAQSAQVLLNLAHYVGISEQVQKNEEKGNRKELHL